MGQQLVEIEITAIAFDEISAFARHVRLAENQPLIRVVISKSQYEFEQEMRLRAGLDQGEISGLVCQHLETGLDFVFPSTSLEGLSGQLVVWMTDIDDLRLAILPRTEFIELMGDAQGPLVKLRAAGSS